MKNKIANSINSISIVLETIISNYNKDPKEGKYFFVLQYLHVCSVFIFGENRSNANYFNAYTFIENKVAESGDYMLETVSDLVETEIRSSTWQDVEQRKIKIITSKGESFAFSIEDYTKNYGNYIWGHEILGEKWAFGYEKDKLLNLKKIGKTLVAKNKIYGEDDDDDAIYYCQNNEHADLCYKNKELVVIAGRPAMGKTALAINSLLDYSHDYKIVYISLNDLADNVTRHFINAKAGIESLSFYSEKHNIGDYKKALQATESFSNIYVYETSHKNIYELERIISGFKQIKPSLIVIDDYQCIHYENNYPKNNKEAKEIAKRLKKLSIEMNLTVVALSRVRRDLEDRKDKHPLVKDLLGSNGLEEVADRILMIYRDGYYRDDEEKRGEIELFEVNSILDNKHYNYVFAREIYNIWKTNDEFILINEGLDNFTKGKKYKAKVATLEDCYHVQMDKYGFVIKDDNGEEMWLERKEFYQYFSNSTI